jgi:acetaldehyde dehydrogenase (acetylating)
VAGFAGFGVPDGTRILVTRLQKAERSEPLAHEKLTTVLAWYDVEGWEQGCDYSIALIETGGRGHTQIIHAQDEKVIMAFGLEKPVFRILVNTMGTMGAIGATTGVMPSFTLGSGGIGGAITGDNISAYHLMNIKRLAYETRLPPLEALLPGEPAAGPNPLEVEKVVRSIVEEVLAASRAG